MPRTYDAEFRRRVVELVWAGRPVRVVAAELELLPSCPAMSGHQAPHRPGRRRFRQAARSSWGWPRSASAVSGSAPPAKSLPGTIGPGSVRRTGMASAPPTKSEPTGMVSCRIGLVVRVCVGMQCNSKRYIEGDAVGAASPAPIPASQATRSIRIAPRWVLNPPPLESKATAARSAPASRRVRFLICQGPGSLRRHWRGPAGRRVRSQPPSPRPRITPSPGPASRAGQARRPGRRRRPSHPRSRR